MSADPTSAARFVEDGEPFEGFPNSGVATTVPSLFFSRVLPEIESAEELVVSVYSFFAQAGANRKRRPRYVTRRELEADRGLMRTLARLGRGSAREALRAGLTAAVKRGTLARAVVETEAGREELFVANNPSNRKALGALEGQRLELEPSLPRTGGEPVSNIFTLYEENIGSITPLIAEDLKEAEERYPVDWIREAMREAVLGNKRSWRYVHTILRRWETEGPDHEESERDPQIEWLERRYVEGRRTGRTSRS